ncbi:PREDICTED: receptor-like protein kinase HAIKU2 [Ipomoea nil]|uniref:receptor-like protein kinase HAIKU2 n=1 Tax=Ipomoea nil TaxID=35883 RepID=UPI00090089AA|nr:PREDICTED: receptor-like protein kinase HAIKU2 [Ipomoea nil]
MSALSELTHLYMDCRRFAGKFLWNSHENVTKLEVLRIRDNSFEKTLFLEVITKRTRWNLIDCIYRNVVWKLELYSNELTVKLPVGFGNLTNLEFLDGSKNYLYDDLSEIRHLTQLLELYSNELTEKLPVGFGNLTNLEFLDGSKNYLYDDLSEIRNLTQLVAMSALSELTHLYMDRRRFVGKFLWNSHANVTKLESGMEDSRSDWKSYGAYRFGALELYSNELTEKLPVGFGNLTNLEFLDGSKNYLYDDLSEIRNLTQLHQDWVEEEEVSKSSSSPAGAAVEAFSIEAI